MTTTRTPRGRTVALVAAVGVVAVAAVAASRSGELATRYYLYRLESDENYLERLVDVAELSTAQHEALREYSQSAEGGSALLSLFVSYVIGTGVNALHRMGWREFEFIVNRDGDCSIRMRSADRSSVSLPIILKDPAFRDRIRRLHAFLRHVETRELTLKRYPPFKFVLQWQELGSKRPLVRATSRQPRSP